MIDIISRSVFNLWWLEVPIRWQRISDGYWGVYSRGNGQCKELFIEFISLCAHFILIMSLILQRSITISHPGMKCSSKFISPSRVISGIHKKCVRTIGNWIIIDHFILLCDDHSFHWVMILPSIVWWLFILLFADHIFYILCDDHSFHRMIPMYDDHSFH